jgi:peptidyl-prolyl cis-trans isomerase C
MSARIPIVAAFALALSSVAVFAQGAGDDPVIAIVNGHEIHRSELEAAQRGLPDQYRQVPLQMIYGPLLDRVIDSRLLSDEAERSSVAEDSNVQEQLARARAQVLRDAMVEQRLEQGITEEKLRERYEQAKQKDDFAHEEVQARHILLPSEEEAKGVIEQLQQGADFGELAKEKSIGPSAETGGDLGFFRREQMVPEFAEVAFALEVGAISEQPVQTQFGWHVIHVLDKRKVEPTFAESEPQLREEIAREIVTALLDDLRGGATIERFNLDGSPMEATPEPEAPDPGQAPGAGETPKSE